LRRPWGAPRVDLEMYLSGDKELPFKLFLISLDIGAGRVRH